MQLVEFLSSKALEQFKEILEDKEFVREHLYDWLNNSFIMDGLSSVSLDDKKKMKCPKRIYWQACFPVRKSFRKSNV